MSAAIKRLSTIIRPHPHTQASSVSPQKETPKPQSSSVAPTAPPDTENNTGLINSSAPAPTTMSTTAAPADSSIDAAVAPAAVDPTIASSSAPEHPTAKDEGQAVTTSAMADAPATTEAAQEPPVPTESAMTEEKTEATPATKTSDMKHETTSVKEKSRRTRDIGRDTIRRFSTILRPGNGSHTKEKDAVPPVPAPASKAKEEETTKTVETTTPAADTETPAATIVAATAAQPEPDPTPTPAVVEKQEKPKDSKPAKPAKSASAVSKTKEKEKDKTEKPKAATRRGSSFFSAARDVVRGPRKDTSKSKPTTASKAESVAAKVTKKGAAKGKRVVVITGASRGSGLEFVKQYAVQPDTFVIALSRTVDKATEIRTIVNESAKFGHNVRPVRVDIGNTKSVASAVKEIVELTDGRIDLLIHAAGTKNESPLRIGDIKGPELEEELRYNLVGPVAFTNALLAYLKPFPPPPPPAAEVKETEEAKNAVAPVETDKAEKTEVEAKAEVAEESKPETDTNKETPALPETKEGEAEVAAATATATATAPQDTISAAPAEAEQTPAPAAAEPVPAIQSTTETPSAAEPITTTVEEAKQADTEPVAAAAAVPLPADSTPVPDSTLVEEMAPTPVSAPVYFPPNPCVVFLTPSDPIFNSQGSVPGGSFVPSPKTLFSLSRCALQVAIAKYAMSLGGQAINVVGIERPGILDPHSTIADAQAVKSVLEYLPSVTLNKSGRLLRI